VRPCNVRQARTIFFATDFRKLLWLKELRALSAGHTAQSIQTKYFTGKVLKNKGLRYAFPALCENIVLTRLRKILITG
jgi:hypothetical protein